jgi:hypothetical protein
LLSPFPSGLMASSRVPGADLAKTGRDEEGATSLRDDGDGPLERGGLLKAKDDLGASQW